MRQTTEKQIWPIMTRRKSKNQKRKKKPNRKKPQRIKKNRNRRKGENHDRNHRQSKASRVERKINQDKSRNQFRGVDLEVDRNQKREEKQVKIEKETNLSKSLYFTGWCVLFYWVMTPYIL